MLRWASREELDIISGWLGDFWVELALALELRDMWIGLYWKRWPRAVELYLCLVPCLPLRLYIERQR